MQRLKPADYPFRIPINVDIHAMIWSEDALALERELHSEFVKAQVNIVNPRKEFFRVSIKNLREAIETRGIETSWTMRAVAAEFRESLAIEERLKSSPLLEEDWVRQQTKYEIQKETELVEN